MRIGAGWILLIAISGCEPAWKAVDADGDGFGADVDCWDNPAATPNRSDGGASGIRAADIHPEAAETWYDGIDQNCDGLGDFDQDGDGFRSARHPELGATTTTPGDDCFDGAADAFGNPGDLPPELVYPGADDAWYDGTDADCEGNSDYDQDGDGQDSKWHDALTPNATDCFDDAGDDEEHGVANEAGFGPADVYTGADDVAYDGTDANCDGQDDYDQDGDGAVCAGPPAADGSCDGDCDDGDPTIGASAAEIWYDGVDQDCDGNDGDQDGDGVYAADYAFAIPASYGRGDCHDEPGTVVALNGWPDLTGAEIRPDATDTWYDGIDQDCDGADDFDQDDDGARSLYQADETGAYGTDCFDTTTDSFDNPGGLSPDRVYPGAPETLADATDADCAGDVDADGDGDLSAAEGGPDCDDSDPTRATTLAEQCSTAGVDDNCDGVADEANAEGCGSFYTDADADGFGIGDGACVCVPDADQTATVAGDCDDNDAGRSPAATETCATGGDDDCDGDANEVDAPACVALWPDTDGDGYGDAAGSSTCWCEAPDVSWVADQTDCDDSSATLNPGASEQCDAADDDCDGEIDEDLPLYYLDADGDGFGDESDPGTCDPDASVDVSTEANDCDDDDPWVWPGAEEYCDGVQNDCDAAAWDSTAEDGLVTQIFSDDSRSNLDWTVYDGAPAILTLATADRDSTIQICRGTWNVGIYAPSNITIDVVGMYGASDTTLDGLGVLVSSIRVADFSQVYVSGLTLTGGKGFTDSTGITIGGGAVVHTSAAGQGTTDDPNLLLSGCVIEGNSATRGGGIAVGRAGSATRYGYAKLVDTLVNGNDADETGGGAWVSLGVLECVASDPSINAGFTNNVAASAGGAYIYGHAGTGVGPDNGVLVSSGCEWGTPGVDDNAPDDLGSHGDATTSAQGDDASFTCSYADCP